MLGAAAERDWFLALKENRGSCRLLVEATKANELFSLLTEKKEKGPEY